MDMATSAFHLSSGKGGSTRQKFSEPTDLFFETDGVDFGSPKSSIWFMIVCDAVFAIGMSILRSSPKFELIV